MTVNSDFSTTASCEQSSGQVLVLKKEVGWGHKNEAFCFSKRYAFKRIIRLHHKNEKVRPYNRSVLFALNSYHCVPSPVDSTFPSRDAERKESLLTHIVIVQSREYKRLVFLDYMSDLF